MLLIQQSLGIDFREDTLRLVLLGKTFKGVVLVDHLIKTYPALSDKTQDGEVLDELVADLKSFIEGRTRPTDIVLGIPRQKVILRQVKLPILNKEELKEIIAYEIDKHIPLPSQEVYYDYQSLGQISESEQRILLGMVRKEDLDFYLMLLDRAELVPTLATPLCFALKDCPGFNHLQDKGLGLMVDLGEKELEFDLIHKDKLMFSRSLPIVEGKPEDDFSMHQTQRPQGTEKEEDKIDAHTQAIGSGLIFTIKQWLRTAHSSIDDGLSRVVLTGLKIYDTSLSDYLHDQCGIEVYIPNPFQGLTEKKIPGRKASALALATSLATKGLKEKFTDLNLLPFQMRVRRTSHALTFTLVSLTMIFLIMTITAYTGFGKYRFYLPQRLKLEKVVNTSNQLQDQVKQVKELSQRIEEISKEVDDVQNLMSNRISKLEILKELSVTIPQDVWLDKANIDNDKIEINGYADTSSVLIGILEDSPLFENVIFPSTITKRGRDKERFRVKADIQKGLTE